MTQKWSKLNNMMKWMQNFGEYHCNDGGNYGQALKENWYKMFYGWYITPKDCKYGE